MLELVNIRKGYDGKTILDNISFSIKEGEIISMLGPSGSGKTTILNIILGLTSMDSGKLIYRNKDIGNTNMKDRGFNIVFQDYALFPNLNAYENIVYGLRNKKEVVSKDELDNLINFFGLEPHLNKSIFNLSGGQKQRVALARTLVMKPKILLLDEPLSALDGVIKENIKKKIIEITRTLNLTTIIVTHDPEEALTMSDRVLILNEGKIAQFGTPEEIINSPSDDFVDQFILKQLRIKRNNIFKLFGDHNE